MNKELIEKFYKDFPIPTQEEDSRFPYANPSDAARALIRAYNWSGNITESLIGLSEVIKGVESELYKVDSITEKLERLIIAKNPPPSWAVKNKDMQRAYVWSKAIVEDIVALEAADKARDLLRGKLLTLKKDFDLYSMMHKHLERSTEWLTNYINWCKFELRDLHINE